MALAGSVALALAERVEKSGGARAGFVAYRALAANAGDADTRAKALLAGVRCVTELRDAAGLAELVALWVSIDRGDWAEPVAAACRDLARAKLDPTGLAHAEATLRPTALALYTYARCLDVARNDLALEAFGRALAQAEKEGAARVTAAARLRRMQLFSKSWATLGEALVAAAKLDPAADRIAIARVLLFSPSRFTRAAAIGHLVDAASDDNAEIRFRARRLAARYADEAADAITPLERDRLKSLLKPAPVAAIAERAQDLLRGRYEVPRLGESLPDDPVARRIERHHQVLDVFAALRDEAPARAAHVLDLLTRAMESDERLPREAVAVAMASLGTDSAELRAAALRFFAAWLKTPSFIVPPRGYLALADALGEAGEVARRAAALRKETGAMESLAILLTRVGWEAARADNRPHAIQTLREAKALSSG